MSTSNTDTPPGPDQPGSQAAVSGLRTILLWLGPPEGAAVQSPCSEHPVTEQSRPPIPGEPTVQQYPLTTSQRVMQAYREWVRSNSGTRQQHGQRLGAYPGAERPRIAPHSTGQPEAGQEAGDRPGRHIGTGRGSESVGNAAPRASRGVHVGRNDRPAVMSVRMIQAMAQLLE